MLRKIITIDESLCDGCGDCITSCSEGALQLIDGKAKLVKEDFCDGFGDCIGHCPTGALKIEMKEANPFDVEATKQHVLETQGIEAAKHMEAAHIRHLAQENQPMVPQGCPGSRVLHHPQPEQVSKDSSPADIPSALQQWPIQIHLVPPNAPFFQNKELVIMNTCGPLASANVHSQYLHGRSVVVGCPKLDYTEPYSAKLASILQESSIPKIIIVRMEVPCCGGLTMIAQKAVELSGRDDIIVEEDTLSLRGELVSQQIIPVVPEGTMVDA